MSRSDEPRDASREIELVYRQLGLDEPETSRYFAGLRALTNFAEAAPEFVLSYNSFPIETK